jgi:hypothetical protein
MGPAAFLPWPWNIAVDLATFMVAIGIIWKGPGLLWLFLRKTARTIINIDKMATNRQAMVDLADIAPELKALPGRIDGLERAMRRLEDRIGKLR